MKKILLLSKLINISLIIGIICIIYKIFKKKKKKIIKERFKNKEEYINFFDKKIVNNFINNDNDNYINNLSSYDLVARKCKLNNEYKTKIINCISNFSELQKQVITEGTIEADKFLKNYNDLFDGNDILKYKWNFALTTNNNNDEYEEGLPHTREDIIFLSDKIIPNKCNSNFINTLIHEKIHIFQRYNTDLMEKIINNLGFKRTSEKNIKQRSNPDLNKYIYINKNNEKLQCLYDNNNPTSIQNVNCLNNTTLFEHPYEYLAYTIANKYNALELKKYINTI